MQGLRVVTLLAFILFKGIHFAHALQPPVHSIDALQRSQTRYENAVDANELPSSEEIEQTDYEDSYDDDKEESSETVGPSTFETTSTEIPTSPTVTTTLGTTSGSLPPIVTTESGTTSEETTTTTQEPTTPAPPHVPKVSIPGLGTAKGRILTSFEGRPFYGFMSIPYAEPPVGDLRFKYPEPWEREWPAEDEEGNYEAVYLRAKCIQVSMILNVTAGREDCLHLNIYTPLLPEDNPSKDLPVMVWFHGGAYMTGEASLYIPTKLMDRQVMVVVVQYRLGSLGFLAGSDPGAPGNMGLMDQIMSLRWVQQNIKYFGGDNDKVTVFGQSAGGASASWMQITPLTQGSAPANNGSDLLHRVIPQSGSSLEIWTIDHDPEAGFDLTAETLKCNTTNDKVEILECMRNKTADEVNKASSKIYADDRLHGGLGFTALCPVVQTTLADLHPEMEIVIPKSPKAILEEGEFLKIPMMAGTVRDDGSLVVGLAYKDFMVPNNHTEDDIDFIKYETIPSLLGAFGLTDQNSAVANTMKMNFFPYAEMGNWSTMVGGMVDMTGVLFLKSGLWEVANKINRVDPTVPIYFYSWEFESDNSLFPWIFSSIPDIPVPGGIGHADELPYFFSLPSSFDEREKNVSSRATTLWTNFAKYGNPTPPEIKDPSESWDEVIPTWETYDNDDYKFMIITDKFSMLQDFTTRWHHHRGDANNQRVLAMDSVDENGTTPDSRVPRDVYEAQVEHEHNLNVAIGVFEGVLALAVVAGCIFAIFQRQTMRANGIV